MHTILFLFALRAYSESATYDFPYLYMTAEGTTETNDHDKPLTFDKRDITTFVMASFLIMIAAGGGIGGGGVLVPTYIFVLGFVPQYAIPLSNATILGSSLANILFNAGKRHPEANRPLIDWDIMLVMEPVTIAGALIGSFINVLSPPWLICIMLVLLLTATAIKSYKKGIKMYNKETKALEAAAASRDTQPGQDLKKGLVGYDHLPEAAPDCEEALEQAMLDKNRVLYEILFVESSTPTWKVVMMVFVTTGMLALTILKGGGKINPLHITCGSYQYWAITLAAFPLVFIVSFIARNHLVHKYNQKKRCGFKYLEGDVEWDEANTIRYPLICSIAGLCAGMFGIGGGIVKGPLMLEMGVRPEVCSATSATMILFTSAAATASYLLFESLNPQYGMMVFILGFFNTLIGQKLLNIAVKQYGRSSIIVLLIATIIAMSAVAMGLQSGGSIIDLFSGKAAPAKSIC